MLGCKIGAWVNQHTTHKAPIDGYTFSSRPMSLFLAPALQLLLNIAAAYLQCLIVF